MSFKYIYYTATNVCHIIEQETKDVIKSTIRRAQTIASRFRFLTPKSMNKNLVVAVIEYKKHQPYNFNN